MNATHLVTTSAVGAACPRCRRPVLAGLAEGLPARVDLVALNPEQEIAALIDNRWTYVLSRGELVYRDVDRISGGRLRGPILAAHRCASNARITRNDESDSPPLFRIGRPT